MSDVGPLSCRNGWEPNAPDQLTLSPGAMVNVLGVQAQQTRVMLAAARPVLVAAINKAGNTVRTDIAPGLSRPGASALNHGRHLALLTLVTRTTARQAHDEAPGRRNGKVRQGNMVNAGCVSLLAGCRGASPEFAPSRSLVHPEYP